MIKSVFIIFSLLFISNNCSILRQFRKTPLDVKEKLQLDEIKCKGFREDCDKNLEQEARKSFHNFIIELRRKLITVKKTSELKEYVWEETEYHILETDWEGKRWVNKESLKFIKFEDASKYLDIMPLKRFFGNAEITVFMKHEVIMDWIPNRSEGFNYRMYIDFIKLKTGWKIDKISFVILKE